MDGRGGRLFGLCSGIECVSEDQIRDRDKLEVPLLDEVSAHGIGDEEVRICRPPEVGFEPRRF